MMNVLNILDTFVTYMNNDKYLIITLLIKFSILIIKTKGIINKVTFKLSHKKKNVKRSTNILLGPTKVQKD